MKRTLWAAMLFCCLTAASLADAASVTLTWDAPIVGVPTGYTMYRKVNNGTFELLANLTASVLTYTDTAPQIGLNTYHVTAFNAEGESPPSNEVTFNCLKPKGRRGACGSPPKGR